MGLTADQATRITPLVLTGVILAGGFALVVHLSPRGDVSPGEILPESGVLGGKGPELAEWPTSDWLALSVNMRELNHLVDVDVDDGVDGGGGDGGPDQDPELGGKKSDGPEMDENGNPKIPEYVSGDFKFVGVIVSGDRSVALISLDDKQRFVGPDDEIGKHTIVTVHAEYLIVRVDGVDRRMLLTGAERKKQNTVERYISDRERAMEQQRLLREQQRSRRGLSAPDIGDGL